ncbi:MAG: Na+/H+ antiporter subunit E [Candidatus Thiodiazotropha sp. (ex Codakia rugifera)]|nr:Na+/H+ antiporter subunit E [Candidatus Thiodiazotropha sp. (ex Codakia rugifera)]
MKILGYGIYLIVFWILLSGHFEPLLLGLGVASVLLTVYLASRMNIIDHESYPLHLASRYPAFFVYIIIEIVRANIDVVKRIIISRGKTISPQLVEIPVPQKTDLGRVIYANTITLTPGTLSVSLAKDKVVVHALTRKSAENLFSGCVARHIPDRAVKK